MADNCGISCCLTNSLSILILLKVRIASGSGGKTTPFFQHDEALVTDREPYLGFALSGEEVVTTELGESGVAFLIFFIRLNVNIKLGMIFGVVSTFPLRNQIHAHFLIIVRLFILLSVKEPWSILLW